MSRDSNYAIVSHDGKTYYQGVCVAREGDADGSAPVAFPVFATPDGEVLGGCGAVGVFAVLIAQNPTADVMRQAAKYLGGELSIKAAELSQGVKFVG